MYIEQKHTSPVTFCTAIVTAGGPLTGGLLFHPGNGPFPRNPDIHLKTGPRLASDEIAAII